MGIDSIGKKGPPTPPAGGNGAGHSAGSRRAEGAEPQRPFEVSRTGPVAGPPRETAAQAVRASPATALDRLRAGEIDVNGYVDIKVEEATTHLRALPPSQLEQVRAALRDRMASDPALIELVRTATGSVPRPPSDE
jgi:hypothetical protein